MKAATNLWMRAATCLCLLSLSAGAATTVVTTNIPSLTEATDLDRVMVNTASNTLRNVTRSNFLRGATITSATLDGATITNSAVSLTNLNTTTLNAGSVTGDGSGLTNLDGGNLQSGTVDTPALSTAVQLNISAGTASKRVLSFQGVANLAQYSNNPVMQGGDGVFPAGCSAREPGMWWAKNLLWCFVSNMRNPVGGTGDNDGVEWLMCSGDYGYHWTNICEWPKTNQLYSVIGPHNALYDAATDKLYVYLNVIYATNANPFDTWNNDIFIAGQYVDTGESWSNIANYHWLNNTNPIFSPSDVGTNGSGQGVYCPQVVKIGTNYTMFYAVFPGRITHGNSMATADTPDATTWTPVGGTNYIAIEGAEEPNVFQFTDGTWINISDSFPDPTIFVTTDPLAQSNWVAQSRVMRASPAFKLISSEAGHRGDSSAVSLPDGRVLLAYDAYTIEDTSQVTSRIHMAEITFSPGLLTGFIDELRAMRLLVGDFANTSANIDATNVLHVARGAKTFLGTYMPDRANETNNMFWTTIAGPQRWLGNYYSNDADCFPTFFPAIAIADDYSADGGYENYNWPGYLFWDNATQWHLGAGADGFQWEIGPSQLSPKYKWTGTAWTSRSPEINKTITATLTTNGLDLKSGFYQVNGSAGLTTNLSVQIANTNGVTTNWLVFQSGLLTAVNPYWNNAPTNVSGLKLWLDVASFAGHANGTLETNWPDLSGNDNDGTHFALNSGPNAYYTNVNGIGTNPAICFGGAGSTNGAYYRFGAITARPLTVFMVLQKNAFIGGLSGELDVPLGSASTGSDHWAIYCDSEESYTKRFNVVDGAISSATTTNIYAYGTPLLITVKHAASSAPSLYTNGVAVTWTTSNSGNTGNLNKTYQYVGAHNAANYASNMRLGELLIYDSAIADADRQAIETYLKTKWGL